MKLDKKSKYELLLKQADAVLEGEANQISIMSTLVGLLKNEFEDMYWVGFYINDNGVLKVGPYQGTLGCLTIEPHRGVCGRAFRTGVTQIVKNVHNDPEHIACDPKSTSEIVVPLISNESIIAVLDVDSEKIGAFDTIDRKYLELFLDRFL